jgi:myo-inositol-1(or 4)-monophosphatase
MVAGVIYDPLRDEMFSAARGKGATLNGEPIHVSRTQLAGRVADRHGAFPARSGIAARTSTSTRSSRCARTGCVALGRPGIDLAYVACGRLDGYWEFQLNPWDTSAGYLLVEEAGGRITHFDGGKFTLDSREILASNGLIHPAMEHLFADMFAGRNLEPIATPAEFAARRAATDDLGSRMVRADYRKFTVALRTVPALLLKWVKYS